MKGHTKDLHFWRALHTTVWVLVVEVALFVLWNAVFADRHDGGLAWLLTCVTVGVFWHEGRWHRRLDRELTSMTRKDEESA